MPLKAYPSTKSVDPHLQYQSASFTNKPATIKKWKLLQLVGFHEERKKKDDEQTWIKRRQEEDDDMS